MPLPHRLYSRTIYEPSGAKEPVDPETDIDYFHDAIWPRNALHGAARDIHQK